MQVAIKRNPEKLPIVLAEQVALDVLARLTS